MLRRVGASLWLGLSLVHSLPAEDEDQEDRTCMLQKSATKLTKSVSYSVDKLTLDDGGSSVGLIVLSNGATGESVDIAYTFGGKVDAIRLTSPVTGQVREMVVTSNRSASGIVNMGWAANEMLIPFANRIDNGTYELDGTTYHLMPRTDHPSPGVNNAIHGFLMGKKMTQVKESATSEAASVTLSYEFNQPDDPESQPQGYPFHLYVELTYTLDVSGFSVHTLAKNLAPAGGPLPFYMGMHPYFTVEDVSKSVLLFDDCSGWNNILVNHTSLIPTTNTTPFDGFKGQPFGGTFEKPAVWDNGFKATDTVTCHKLETQLYDPSTGDSSVLWVNALEYPWLQVFTGGTPSLGQAVAVEPMSGETNAYNNHQAGTLLIQAGESWQGTFGFRIAEPSPRLKTSS